MINVTPENFKTTVATMWQGLSANDQAGLGAYLNALCTAVGQGQVQATGMSLPSVPGQPGQVPGPTPGGPHGGCNCNNKPGNGCQGGSCQVPGSSVPGNCMPGQIPGMNIPGVPPGCYDCQQVDPCLRPFLENEALSMDAWSWLQLMERDGELVHLDKDIGDDPFVAPDELAANLSALLAQEDAQQTAYIPGLLKVEAKFSDDENHLGKLSMQLFAGPRGLVGLTTTDALIPVGRAYKFTDFKCGEQCYLAPMPKLLMCRNRVIPGPRSLYVKVTAVGLPDGVTVEDISITIIKANTPTYVACCDTYKIPPSL